MFGKSETNEYLSEKTRTHYLGHLQDGFSMRSLYAASDAIAVPSRNDNFPGVAVEAMACGLPVVCFDTCGLKDIVDHKVNGYLAASFNASDLADGVSWVLNHEQPKSVSSAARNKVEEKFSEKIVAEQYLEIYQNVIQDAGAG